MNGQIDGSAGAQCDVNGHSMFSDFVQKNFVEIVIVFIPIKRENVVGSRRD
jgi:hypothetical protein